MLGVKEYPYGASAKYEKFPGGGTARYVIALSEGLVKKGHEVDLIVRRMPGQKRHEISKGIYIHRVWWASNEYLRLPSFNLFSFFRALKVCKSVDIIHCHGSFAPIFGIVLGRIFNRKVVVTPHGTTSFGMRFKYNKVLCGFVERLEKFSFDNADMKVFLNQQEKHNIVRTLHLNSARSAIIYPGINIAATDGRTSHSGFNLIFVGRLVAIKRLDNLIKAAELLDRKFPDKIKLTIVGDGQEMQNLKRLASKLSLQNVVFFRGYSNNVERYLRDADLFVLPSEREGLPASVLEAMAIGVPVMAPRLGLPIQNIITIRDNRPETIAANVEKLYLDNSLVRRVRSQVLREFRNKFSNEKMTERYLQTYGEVISNNVSNCRPNQLNPACVVTKLRRPHVRQPE